MMTAGIESERSSRARTSRERTSPGGARPTCISPWEHQEQAFVTAGYRFIAYAVLRSYSSASNQAARQSKHNNQPPILTSLLKSTSHLHVEGQRRGASRLGVECRARGDHETHRPDCARHAGCV